MSQLYNNPLRVYLIVILVALTGLWSATHLPVSLFPNSSKPQVQVQIQYLQFSSQSFLREHGKAIELRLKGINRKGVKVDEVSAEYSRSDVSYQIEFDWGSDPEQAKTEVENVINGYRSFLPKEVSESIQVWQWNQNTGFFAMSFYSQEKNLDTLFDILDPLMRSELANVEDAEEALVWNPTSKELKIKIDPTRSLKLGITPQIIKSTIKHYLSENYAGKVEFESGSDIHITIPSSLQNVDDFNNIMLRSINGDIIYLKTIAEVSYGQSELEQRVFKTQGAPSLILWAKPKAGGNVKRMSEEIKSIVQKKLPLLPPDIKFKLLVDPSEFINSSIHNVFKEIFIAAGLAVLILFLFLGSFKNVMTAALEIPLSIISAFIMMKLFNVNINLISLGGLALAAGMNVDASVVVLENIFRKISLFKTKHPNKTYEPVEIISIVTESVREVAVPILVSMLTSLIVFIPLILTQDLTNAILSDLAKAVIFSHSLSAFIALILVPTIRSQILKTSIDKEDKKPLLDQFLKKMENQYQRILQYFMLNKSKRFALYLSLAVIFICSLLFVIPHLKKEIIGKPDSDWVIVLLNSSTFSDLQQMESESSRIENEVLHKYPDKISYSFANIREARNSSILFRLRDKKDMDDIWKKLEKDYPSQPDIRYNVFPWNPAELPIPEPAHLKIILKGTNLDRYRDTAEQIYHKLKDENLYDDVWTNPSTKTRDQMTFVPYKKLWAQIQDFSMQDIADITFLAQNGQTVTSFEYNNKSTNINIFYNGKPIRKLEDFSSLFIPQSGKLIPLSALGSIQRVEEPIKTVNINAQERIEIISELKKEYEHLIDHQYDEFLKLVPDIQKNLPSDLTMEWEGPQHEFSKSYSQLAAALIGSLILIFFVLMLQFQNPADAGTVMLAIPLGIIGALVSLFVFQSTLSLNSCLGLILLNGIAVNNSILLIDFSQRMLKMGFDPIHAIQEASKKRLRPILITSLTTIIGMLPIALAYGDGGKILQPLGIAVSGGLWFSTLLTLLVIPLFYYDLKKNKKYNVPILYEEDMDTLYEPGELQ